MDVDIDTEKTNPFEPGVDNPGADEDIELHPMTSSRRGSADPTGHHRTYEETSFGGDASDTTPLIITNSLVEEKRAKAWEVVEREFPNAEASLIADYNKDGKLTIQKSIAKRPNILFTKNRTTGEQQINPKLPDEIIKVLGTRVEKIIENNEDKITRSQEIIAESQEQLATTSDEHVRERLNQTIAEKQDAINQLEIANEKIEQRVTLRDRVKAIFKKIWVHRICCSISCRCGHWRYSG